MEGGGNENTEPPTTTTISEIIITGKFEDWTTPTSVIHRKEGLIKELAYVSALMDSHRDSQ